MILWYASGYESLLTRFTHTRARCHRWRDVTRRGGAHLSDQPWQYQALVAPAPEQWRACSQTAHGQDRHDYRSAVPDTALPTRTAPRCQLGRACGALECRPRDQPQLVDAWAGNPPLGLVAKKK